MHSIQRQRIHLLGCEHLLQVDGTQDGLKVPNERPIQDARYAFGNNTAATVLPALGLTFSELHDAATHFAKPILDVGASLSTVACEAHLRGIPIFSTDLRGEEKRGWLLGEVRKKLQTLKDLYTSGAHSPGNECALISDIIWEQKVQGAIDTLSRQLSQCPASDIRLPNGSRAQDKHFAVVYSHHAVPQYCDVSDFLKKDLPELLRVTEHTLVLHPFQFGDGSLNLACEGDAALLQAVKLQATKAGFEFQLLNRPTENFPNAYTARFTAKGC